MASNFTPNKRIEQPGNNDYINTWNVPVNADFDFIDKAFGGTTTLIATSGSTTLTALDPDNVNTSYRSLILASTAALTGNVTYRIPSGVGGQWIVDNRTTGAFTFTVNSLGGGTSVVCAQNARTLIFSDGTNVRLSTDTSIVQGTGITVSGSTVSLTAPVTAVLGGTGFTTYATGDIVYASATNTLSKLTAGTAGYVLTLSGGVPTWAAPSGGSGGGGTVTSITVDGGTTGLTFTPATPITTSGTFSMQGTLGASNGGTGFASYSVGDILYASSATSLAKLSDVATGNALLSGGLLAAPAWGKIGLTTHVSGTLPVANGGTGATVTPTNGQLLIGNGSGYSVASLTNGTGINIVAGSGTITVNNTGPASVTAVTDGGIAVSGTSAITLAQAPYTGTSNTNTNYPIGSTVTLSRLTAFLYMNSSVTLYAGTGTLNDSVNDGGAGSALSGTWRVRGAVGTSISGGGCPVTTYYNLVQRVA